MATLVLLLLAAVAILALVVAPRKIQQAPVLLPIERTPRRIRRRNS